MTWTIAAFVNNVTDALWRMSLQTVVLIMIVLAVRFCLKKFPKIYSYSLWALVLIRLLCPVFVESPLSLQRAYENQVRLRPIETYIQGEQGLSGEDITGNVVSDQSGLSGVPEIDAEPDIEEPGKMNTDRADSNMSEVRSEATTEQEKTDTAKMNILQSIYLAGVLMAAIIYLFQYFKVKRQIASAVRVEKDVWLCDAVSSPFVMGVLRPVVYLPYGLGQKEEEHILRHERTHIQHHDPLLRLLGLLAFILHWWNPFVWLAVYWMHQDMEMYCDEAFLLEASMEEKKSYAETLLQFSLKEKRMPVGLAFGESHCEKRVKNVLTQKKKSKVIIGIIMLLVVFCAVAFLTVPQNGKPDDSGQMAGADNENGTGQPGNTQGANAQKIDAESKINLTEEKISWLGKILPYLPEFVSMENWTAELWSSFLFNYYTAEVGKETVEHYNAELGFNELYQKVSQEEADELTRLVLGYALSEKVSPEDISITDGNALFYEDGFFYIKVSDHPDYYAYFRYSTVRDVFLEVVFEDDVGLTDEGWIENIALYLLQADNENGFIISGKETHLSKGMMIEEQSFEVEMEPWGKVLFGAFAPDTSRNPCADVNFHLFRDGKLVYTFPYEDTVKTANEWVFQDVAAVAFRDCNKDGYIDVLAITDYLMYENDFSEARIYTGTQSGDFVKEIYLMEDYNESHDAKTIADLLEFAQREEKQDLYKGVAMYGSWRVTKAMGTTPVYALSPEEIAALLDTKLTYGRYYCDIEVDGKPYTISEYKKSVVSPAELKEEYRIDWLPLTTGSEAYTHYEVVGKEGSLFGTSIYMTDYNQAFIYYEGVFFEIEREESTTEYTQKMPAIEGLTLDSTYEDMSALGNPLSVTPVDDEAVVINKGHYVTAEYEGLIVTLSADDDFNLMLSSSIIAITALSDAYADSNGVKVGTSKEELMQKFSINENHFLQGEENEKLYRINDDSLIAHNIPVYDSFYAAENEETPVTLIYLIKDGYVNGILLRHLTAD